MLNGINDKIIESLEADIERLERQLEKAIQWIIDAENGIEEGKNVEEDTFNPVPGRCPSDCDLVDIDSDECIPNKTCAQYINQAIKGIK